MQSAWLHYWVWWESRERTGMWVTRCSTEEKLLETAPPLPKERIQKSEREEETRDHKCEISQKTTKPANRLKGSLNTYCISSFLLPPSFVLLFSLQLNYSNTRRGKSHGPTKQHYGNYIWLWGGRRSFYKTLDQRDRREELAQVFPFCPAGLIKDQVWSEEWRQLWAGNIVLNVQAVSFYTIYPDYKPN